VSVIGEDALREALRDADIEIVERDADAVVVGLDRQVDYEKLKRATLEIRRGAKFIATNTDRTLPTEEGLTPGAGSIVAALVAATDVEPLIIGKPGRPMFDLALEIAGTTVEETAMLGDRLDTDIDGAAAVGMKTILVLTGVSTRVEAEQNHFKPDFIFEDLIALQKEWTQSD
jgi:4-nitrophenyl phosphatase